MEINYLSSGFFFFWNFTNQQAKWQINFGNLGRLPFAKTAQENWWYPRSAGSYMCLRCVRCEYLPSKRATLITKAADVPITNNSSPTHKAVLFRSGFSESPTLICCTDWWLYQWMSGRDCIWFSLNCMLTRRCADSKYGLKSCQRLSRGSGGWGA